MFSTLREPVGASRPWRALLAGKSLSAALPGNLGLPHGARQVKHEQASPRNVRALPLEAGGHLVRVTQTTANHNSRAFHNVKQ